MNEENINLLAVKTGYESYQNNALTAARIFDYAITKDGIAVVSVYKELATGPSFLYWTTYTSLKSSIERVTNSNGVKGILLLVNSPGGSVHGCMETARLIRQVSKIKPVWVHAEGLCCSAAYLLASAANKIFATKETEIGCCGVICQVYDDTEALQKSGIKKLIFTSKNAKNKYADPSTEEGKKVIQARIDEFENRYYEMLSDFRGIKAEDAIANFGKGSDFLADEALERKMIDGVMDYDACYLEFVKMLSSGSVENIGGENVESFEKMSKEDRKAALAQLLSADPDLRADLGAEIIAEETARRAALEDLRAPGTDALVDEAIAKGTKAVDILKDCFNALKAEAAKMSSKIEAFGKSKNNLEEIEKQAQVTTNVSTPKLSLEESAEHLKEETETDLEAIGLGKEV